MTKPAPGRYCLAVCYCRECPHYQPITRTSDRDDLADKRAKKNAANTWGQREEPTWIDHL